MGAKTQGESRLLAGCSCLVRAGRRSPRAASQPSGVAPQSETTEQCLGPFQASFRGLGPSRGPGWDTSPCPLGYYGRPQGPTGQGSGDIGPRPPGGLIRSQAWCGLGNLLPPVWADPLEPFGIVGPSFRGILKGAFMRSDACSSICCFPGLRADWLAAAKFALTFWGGSNSAAFLRAATF